MFRFASYILIRLLVLVAFLGFFGSASVMHASESNSGCKALVKRFVGSGFRFRPIHQPGNYCLDATYVSRVKRNLWSLKPMTSDLRLLSILVGSVDLDFQGYSLISTEVKRRAIYGLQPMATIRGPEKNPLRKITIHSGQINNEGGSSGIEIPESLPYRGVISDFQPRFGPYTFDRLRWKTSSGDLGSTGPEEYLLHYNDRKADIDRFINSENQIRQMTVRSSKVAVAIAGPQTRIIDSKISVLQGYAATYLRGKAPVIENSILIFKGKAPFETSAPLKLHFADGAIVRNNIFIIEDSDLPADQAISIIRSSGVVIENNRFYGGEQAVRVFDAESEYTSRDNVHETFARRPFIAEHIKAASDVDLSVLWRDRQPEKPMIPEGRSPVNGEDRYLN